MKEFYFKMEKWLEKCLDTWSVVWDWGKRAIPTSCSSGFGIFAMIPLNVLPLGRNFILPSSSSRKKPPFLVRAEMGFSSSQNVSKAGKWRNFERKIPQKFLIPDPFWLSLLPKPLAEKRNRWNLLYFRCFPPKKRCCNIVLMLVYCFAHKRKDPDGSLGEIWIFRMNLRHFWTGFRDWNVAGSVQQLWKCGENSKKQLQTKKYFGKDPPRVIRKNSSQKNPFRRSLKSSSAGFKAGAGSSGIFSSWIWKIGMHQLTSPPQVWHSRPPKHPQNPLSVLQGIPCSRNCRDGICCHLLRELKEVLVDKSKQRIPNSL